VTEELHHKQQGSGSIRDDFYFSQQSGGFAERKSLRNVNKGSAAVYDLQVQRGAMTAKALTIEAAGHHHKIQAKPGVKTFAGGENRGPRCYQGSKSAPRLNMSKAKNQADCPRCFLMSNQFPFCCEKSIAAFEAHLCAYCRFEHMHDHDFHSSFCK
jgi:hypothetical protein